MSDDLTLKQVENSGVLELVEIALSYEEPSKLKCFMNQQDLTKELGVLTPAERKLAFFIQLLGEMTMFDFVNDNSDLTVGEFIDSSYESPIGLRIQALHAYLTASIQVRINSGVEPEYEICWDSDGVVYQSLLPQTAVVQ